ncbi:F-box and associated interaction domains-containing protein [Striga asiatica]|uniref:F-box and associated interaction domains-containing protein n=1 Tax=Striga asiatica TaxID=4170 RepID=A0A5A7PA27_STRAF|nr:F-box and associated interaction domains-containing protein [Striga asiatica]
MTKNKTPFWLLWAWALPLNIYLTLTSPTLPLHETTSPAATLHISPPPPPPPPPPPSPAAQLSASYDHNTLLFCYAHVQKENLNLNPKSRHMFLSKILLARAPKQHRTLHTYALLFKSYQSSFSISARDGRVELSESSPGPTSPARTASSDICLAFSEKESLRHVTLSHRSTGEKLFLPPPIFAGRSKTIRMALWGTAKAQFSSAGKLRKVVLCFPPDQHEAVKADEFHILSVGEGSWRVVSFEPRVSESSSVLITEGFMHWCTKNDEKMLSMNLETEVFTESLGPDYPNNINNNVARKDFRNTYLSTGKYLTLLRQFGEFLWEVWEMSPDTFAWRKMGDFSLEGHKRQYFESKSCDGNVKPVGWVKYLEVLVLSTNITSGRNVLVYNLVTQEMKEIELPTRQPRVPTTGHERYPFSRRPVLPHPQPIPTPSPSLGGATLFLRRASNRGHAMREPSVRVRKPYGL